MKPEFYRDPTYRVIGLIYEVYNRLQYGHKEVIYQRALEELLIKNKISFNKELYCPIRFESRVIGKYYLDYLIDNKLVLELKVAADFYPQHFKQVLNYLKGKSLELALIALITKEGVRIKRIVNSFGKKFA